MKSPTPFAVSQWYEAIGAAATEIATFALGFESATVGPPVDPMEVRGLVGPHISLLGGPSALEFALAGTMDDCRRVAAAMLQSDDPSSLSESDVADAVGEILNMFAGSMKRRMASNGVDLELGLPVFVVGHVRPTEHISVTPLQARFGPIRMFVVVIGRAG
jgi:CheY-specific phosphatase CheX